MKKLSFLLGGCAIILAGLACRERVKSSSEHGAVGSQFANQLQQSSDPIIPAEAPIEQEPPRHKPDQDNHPEPIEGLSLKELDDRIMREAAAQSADPKKYRIFVRDEPRGGKIFRELGMFVIVGAVGDTVYLPDEI